ncbi:hypothetical protein CF386_12460 [Paraphotobacterium marinum]|uniref:Alpha-acetolactate decarboxylase n=1 Tax=Paraphotobacterium marinum TaxID=1755811 RepID=A0A220VHI5_9GAMM|nr:acetolactate decarboxylase [Paraphotobacterium marinum]ASK79844.1 hypothetical protein CF386_12460 [Paraphotobacterium marinum]
MTKLIRLFFIMLSFLSFYSLAQGTLNQWSTVSSLVDGQLGVSVSSQKVISRNNFGIGYGIGLQPVLLIHKKMFVADQDGYVTPFRGPLTFMNSTNFNQPDFVFNVRNINSKQLQKMISSKINNPKLIYAIKINGKFRVIRGSSQSRSDLPFIPASSWMKQAQHEFKVKHSRSLVLGFRLPESMRGINIPGYSFQFIDQEQIRGGQIKSFFIKKAKVKVQVLNSLSLDLEKLSQPTRPTNRYDNVEHFDHYVMSY